MKKLKCNKVNASACTFVAAGESRSEIRRKLMMHKEKRHNYLFNRASADDLLNMKHKINLILEDSN